MKFNHGILFCSGDIITQYKLIVRRTIALAQGTVPNWTLSCSREDQYLGNLGFTCTGNCVEMYDRDCYSEGNRKTGERVANPDFIKYRCDEKGWYASKEAYTEAFVNNIKVLEFWVKSNFYKELEKKYNAFWFTTIVEEFHKLRDLGIPFKVIEV